MLQPLILGSGRAGQVIAKSLACLALQNPDLGLQPARFLKRGANLEREVTRDSVMAVAGPPGLHAEAVLAASRAGARAILCEKPACVSLEEVRLLREVKTPTAVLHVYRQTWGVATLKEMLASGEFGELIAIEGRYWQASTAERALGGGGASTWKNDPALSGPFDVFFDVGTHWIDAVSFLMGAAPETIRGWRSFVNAERPHRDSHVQVEIAYPGARRATASISKTVHGATNHFEINILGSRKSATWMFLSPDEIFIGEGRERRVITRKSTDFGSHQPPFHGMGWAEGYIDIASRLLTGSGEYPTLKEHVAILEPMLSTTWI